MTQYNSDPVREMFVPISYYELDFLIQQGAQEFIGVVEKVQPRIFKLVSTDAVGFTVGPKRPVRDTKRKELINHSPQIFNNDTCEVMWLVWFKGYYKPALLLYEYVFGLLKDLFGLKTWSILDTHNEFNEALKEMIGLELMVQVEKDLYWTARIINRERLR